jgi:hypothetical protein
MKKSKRMIEPVCCDEEKSLCEPCEIDEMINGKKQEEK